MRSAKRGADNEKTIEITISGSKVQFIFVGDAGNAPRENVKQMIMKAYSERIKK